ncbi:MAG TPA: hypothetical protein PK705_07700, partial [Clostridia bacterium]|nr:hypothetical protein [Clostridia bacterium]
MNDKEKLKILAEAIDKTDCYFTAAPGRDFCLFCKCSLNTLHDSNCPVLLAEQILKDEANNGVLLTGQKVLVLSKNRKGVIIGGPDSNNLYEVSLTPQWRGCYKREDLLLTPFNDALEELQSDISKPKPSKERFCPSCGEGKVEEVKGTEPYSEDYLMCNECDSTFNKEHMKEMCKSRVDLQKKHMKLYELQHYVDKLIEQGYSDTPVYFDTEAKTYDCHIVPIGSINLVPKEAMGEDYIILYEYQYTEKPEEPLVVHNVMSYKGKNYLKQLSLQCDPSNIDSCKFCSFDKDCPRIDMKC